MASNPPKTTAAAVDPADNTSAKTAPASDEPRVGVDAPADGTPSPEISNDGDDAAAPDEEEPSTGASLQTSIVGGLITLNGAGFEPGQRYDVRFQRPDGSIDNTVARAQDDGSLATYATVKGTGKHEAWLEVLGKRIAGLKFKV